MGRQGEKSTPGVVRVALVVPHIFINDGIRERVIFSPGELALALCRGLPEQGVEVTLFSPGRVAGVVRNETADMGGMERELAGRGYGYAELMKKHPAVFVALARQVQAEIIAKVYKLTNDGLYDVVHIYTNEEDIAMQFAGLCRAPVLFTHHDPFNFLIKYKSVMPRYKDLNWVSVSMSQRRGMPEETNWVGNIYHGVDIAKYKARFAGSSDYFLYVGRIIEPKGVHIAIAAVREYNRRNPRRQRRLVIAGKHYGDASGDDYWERVVRPELRDGVEYAGFLRGERLREMLAGAEGLLVPSTFEEPFGMVSIEAMAAGTPVVGMGYGATAEIVREGVNGFIVGGSDDEERALRMAEAMEKVGGIERRECRRIVEQKFSLRGMVERHAELYWRMSGGGDKKKD